MLAMTDRQGRVFGSIPGLANRARIDVEACRGAIASFLAPDPDSRTKDAEGRRIEEIDGGWRLLNHAKYRALQDQETVKEAKRKWWQENRALDKTRKTRSRSIQAEADTEADTKRKKKKPEATPLPESFGISERVKSWAQQKGYSDLQAYFDFFVGRMRANGKTYVEWDDAFMNCIREDWPELRKTEKAITPTAKACKSCGNAQWVRLDRYSICERCEK